MGHTILMKMVSAALWFFSMPGGNCHVQALARAPTTRPPTVLCENLHDDELKSVLCYNPISFSAAGRVTYGSCPVLKRGGRPLRRPPACVGPYGGSAGASTMQGVGAELPGYSLGRRPKGHACSIMIDRDEPSVLTLHLLHTIRHNIYTWHLAVVGTIFTQAQASLLQ
jgi:hypothetical protein